MLQDAQEGAWKDQDDMSLPYKETKKKWEKGRTLESRWAQKLPFAFLLSEDLVKGAQTEWEL